MPAYFPHNKSYWQSRNSEEFLHQAVVDLPKKFSLKGYKLFDWVTAVVVAMVNWKVNDATPTTVSKQDQTSVLALIGVFRKFIQLVK